MLFEPGRSAPVLTTPGPRDVTPAFSERGSDWFYVRSDRQAIVHCDTGNSCTEIHADPQGPLWPVPSPDSQTIAYLTWLNTPRLKLLSLSNGAVRDLGAAIVDCAPVWTDDEHIWVLQSSERRPEWIEIDLKTSRRSGRRREAGAETADSRDCAMKENPLLGALPAGARRCERVVGDSRDPNAGVAMISAAPGWREAEALWNRRVRRRRALLIDLRGRGRRSRDRERESRGHENKATERNFLEHGNLQVECGCQMRRR